MAGPADDVSWGIPSVKLERPSPYHDKGLQSRPAGARAEKKRASGELTRLRVNVGKNGPNPSPPETRPG